MSRRDTIGIYNAEPPNHAIAALRGPESGWAATFRSQELFAGGPPPVEEPKGGPFSIGMILMRRFQMLLVVQCCAYTSVRTFAVGKYNGVCFTIHISIRLFMLHGSLFFGSLESREPFVNIPIVGMST